MRNLLLAAVAAGTLFAAAAPTSAAVLDDFNRANTAAGLGDDWNTITAGGSISNNQATGGLRALYEWNGAAPYSPNNVEFDFASPGSTTEVYTLRGLLNWDGTSGYVVAVQHQTASINGFHKYSIGYVTRNAQTQQLDYVNGIFADIGVTMASGHLAATVVDNVATLTLTSGANTRTFSYTYGAAQTYSGDGIGIGFVGPGPKIDNFASAAPVPEPATWAMMIGGFGMVGGAMRSRRKADVRFA